MRSYSFLECLIEEHNKEGDESKPKKVRPDVRLEFEGSPSPTKGGPKGHINR
jgi:hypothetical protein